MGFVAALDICRYNYFLTKLFLGLILSVKIPKVLILFKLLHIYYLDSYHDQKKTFSRRTLSNTLSNSKRSHLLR